MTAPGQVGSRVVYQLSDVDAQVARETIPPAPAAAPGQVLRALVLAAYADGTCDLDVEVTATTTILVDGRPRGDGDGAWRVDPSA